MQGALIALAALVAPVLAVAAPPSVPGIDAPELARLGADSVGYRTLILTHKGEPDLQAANAKTGVAPLHDRRLTIHIWYPAQAKPAARRATYSASLWGEPPKPPVRFSVPGIAVPGAAMRGSRHPLVIVSHGYSNAPAAMTWLNENLASKGYVVAAIQHDDPNPYVIDATKRAAPNYHRPRDIVFAAAALRAQLGDQIDAGRVALIGFSQGGYGVLTAGGASLDPDAPAVMQVAGGALAKYARGAAADLVVPGVKAIVALAPAGGGTRWAWGKAGLAGIKAPLLLIAGDRDQTVDYTSGAATFFSDAVNAERYLLTFKQAGHAIGLNPAPPEMRNSLWDLDWFEDPIWRQDRVNAINLHFITAFLGVHLRGEKGLTSYLDVPVVNGSEGEWNPSSATPWGAYSPGGEGVTLWKGFQRRHAEGLSLQHAAAAK